MIPAADRSLSRSARLTCPMHLEQDEPNDRRNRCDGRSESQGALRQEDGAIPMVTSLSRRTTDRRRGPARRQRRPTGQGSGRGARQPR